MGGGGAGFKFLDSPTRHVAITPLGHTILWVRQPTTDHLPKEGDPILLLPTPEVVPNFGSRICPYWDLGTQPKVS